MKSFILKSLELVISAFLGAFLGGLIAYYLIFYQLNLQSKLDRKNQSIEDYSNQIDVFDIILAETLDNYLNYGYEISYGLEVFRSLINKHLKFGIENRYSTASYDALLNSEIYFKINSDLRKKVIKHYNYIININNRIDNLVKTDIIPPENMESYVQNTKYLNDKFKINRYAIISDLKYYKLGLQQKIVYLKLGISEDNFKSHFEAQFNQNNVLLGANIGYCRNKNKEDIVLVHNIRNDSLLISMGNNDFADFETVLIDSSILEPRLLSLNFVDFDNDDLSEIVVEVCLSNDSQKGVCNEKKSQIVYESRIYIFKWMDSVLKKLFQTTYLIEASQKPYSRERPIIKKELIIEFLDHNRDFKSDMLLKKQFADTVNDKIYLNNKEYLYFLQNNHFVLDSTLSSDSTLSIRELLIPKY